MEVSYNTMSGTLTIVPDPGTNFLARGPQAPTATCFLVFDGVGLTQDGLKDWLRLCVKQVNRRTVNLSYR